MARHLAHGAQHGGRANVAGLNLAFDHPRPCRLPRVGRLSLQTGGSFCSQRARGDNTSHDSIIAAPAMGVSYNLAPSGLMTHEPASGLPLPSIIAE